MVVKAPGQMTEEEYVAKHLPELPELNEAYIRARWKWMKGEMGWEEVTKAYYTTDASKKQKRVTAPDQVKNKSSKALKNR
jgi:deoxyribodipyrimidine photolyase